jgi:hypothetical protein
MLVFVCCLQLAEVRLMQALELQDDGAVEEGHVPSLLPASSEPRVQHPCTDTRVQHIFALCPGLSDCSIP